MRNASVSPSKSTDTSQFFTLASLTHGICRLLLELYHRRRWFCWVAFTLYFPAAASAVDGLALEVGSGDESAFRAGAAVQWDWENRWFTDREWFLGGYWELSASYWKSDRGCCGNDELFEIGATPVFRLQTDRPSHQMTPFFEAGVGGHLLSKTHLGKKDFATNFQFGSHIGAGIRFGSKSQFELLYRFQHLSNASIKQPNDGINFHLLRFGYRM